MLTVIAQSTGHVLDGVSLVDGALAYTTGVSRPYVEGPRRVKPSLTDADLYALAADTSNGYITIKSGGDD